jgi:uncharacterized membrane protein
MQNIVLILVLLIGPFLGLPACGVPAELRGRIAITCVFLFTGLGHFLKAKSMSAMVPLRFPQKWRMPIIYISGVFELAMAFAVLVDSWAKFVGLLLCGFLVVVLPANIDSAVRCVPFGGHSAGSPYLIARIPLQILLFGWIWWFTIPYS